MIEEDAGDVGALGLGGRWSWDRVEVEGRWLPQRQFLLDNRTHEGRAGYEVLTLSAGSPPPPAFVTD